MVIKQIRIIPCLRAPWPAWLWALLLPVISSLSPATAATMLAYISSSPTLVGVGQSLVLTPEDGFFFQTYPSSGNHFSLGVWGTLPNEEAIPTFASWYLNLAAPAQQDLTVGRYNISNLNPLNPGDSTAYLNFQGYSAAIPNTLSGVFEILEVSLVEDGMVEVFAADFLQYQNDDLNQWVKGAIRINSDAPISLDPEPYGDPSVNPSEPPILPDPSHGEHTFSSSGSTAVSSGDLNIQTTTAFNVPGPLPIAGAAVGWHSARRLRRRCKKT